MFVNLFTNKKDEEINNMKALINEIKEKAIEHAMTVAEDQASIMKGGVVEWIKSDEFETQLAEMMDKAINIPFVKDEKEEKHFRALADIIQNLIAGFVGQIKIK